MPQSVKNLITSCVRKRSVKRSSDSAPPHTKHTKTAVPQITESSQVEGRAVVGRRVRDPVRPDGGDNLSLLERAGVVVVDHLENLARRGQELGAELLVGRRRRAMASFAKGLIFWEGSGLIFTAVVASSG